MRFKKSFLSPRFQKQKSKPKEHFPVDNNRIYDKRITINYIFVKLLNFIIMNTITKIINEMRIKRSIRILISRGNHEEIMQAIKNKFFLLNKKKSYGFTKIIKRGNHEEIMTFLDYYPKLNKKEISQLIKRVPPKRNMLYEESHEEIMFAIENQLFTIGDSIHGFDDVLERGNHEEIMAFINYPNGILLRKPSIKKLIKRGNHEEIMQVIKNYHLNKKFIVYCFYKIVKRGNHDEITAFLNYYPEVSRYK